MSHDSFLFLDTPASQTALSGYLLEKFRLKSSDGWLNSPHVNISIRVWQESDRALSQINFGPATLVIKFMPRSSDDGFAAQLNILAAILAVYPGDASLEFGEGGVELLRLKDVVYLDPNGLQIEDLADVGYQPMNIEIGIPVNVSS